MWWSPRCDQSRTWKRRCGRCWRRSPGYDGGEGRRPCAPTRFTSSLGPPMRSKSLEGDRVEDETSEAGDRSERGDDGDGGGEAA